MKNSWPKLLTTIKQMISYYDPSAKIRAVYLLGEQREQPQMMGLSLKNLGIQQEPNQCQNNDQKLIIIWQFIGSQQIWTEIFFDKEYNTLNIQSYLVQNGIITKFTEKFLVGVIISVVETFNRYFITNQLQIQASFNPEIGVPMVSFKTLIHHSQQQTFVNVTLAQPLCEIIFNNIKLSLIMFQFLLSLKQNCPNTDFYAENNQSSQLLKSQKIIQILEVLICEKQTNPLEDTEFFTTLKNDLKFFDLSYQSFSTEIQAILHDLTSQRTQISHNLYNNNQIIMDAFPQYDWDVDEEENSILKKIVIVSNPMLIAWEYVSEGGFGIIEKAYVQYELHPYNDQEAKPLKTKGWIIRKRDNSSQTSKIKHQQHILARLSDEYYPFIMTHYVSEQKQFEDSLFSKFEPHLSLDKFISRNKKTITIATIFKLLQEAVKGLMFLNSQNFIHFDVKASNIIVTSKFQAKISDFGECLSSQFNEKQVVLSYYANYNRGFTSSYMAPQLFHPANEWIFSQPYATPPKNTSNRKKIFQETATQKLDVYSMGITLYKTIFESHLRGEIKALKILSKVIKEEKEEIIYIPERLQGYGFSRLLRIVVNLIFKSLNRLQQNRPNLFYMSIVIALSRIYLTQIEKEAFDLFQVN